MRDIEFRGKCLKAGEWFYGDLVTVEDRAFICSPSMIEVDPETVGQFTGVKDKNGKKIYEGDIVRKRTRLGVLPCEVFFVDGYFCCGWGGGSSTATHPYLLDDSRIEVIGNAHDEPELLKSGG